VRRLTRRQRIAAIVLAVLAVCFITLDLGGGGLRGAHSGVRGTLGALYRGTDTVLGPVRRWAQGLPSAGSSQARIDELEHENAVLRGRLARVRTDQRTARAVTALQRAAAGLNRSVLPARVIAFGPGEGFDWTVTIDVGQRDGVRTGQSVIDGADLVGRVLHSDSSSAVVLLAADPGSGVGARDERTGEIGTVTGSGTAGLVFAPLRPHVQVAAGDELVTGPSAASSYVAGLAIGTVRYVRTSASGSVLAAVTPAVSPTTLDVVGVITGRART
jgi:rod shape-determining protein MreC